ncbi:MAG: tRNA (adenosine(37)-N6)-threonylcarbamoyltransferase complex ATPase subunit type 1 TsaE [Lautropia sp.]|nr:tRNA (adenosine(37)-N6)-threonylcarbamoyltransferase complex ATPase subunit type 1 TsaE [Lautropia sp.]
MDPLDLRLKDELATGEWAAMLAGALAAEPVAEQAFVVHLSGDLGAGKTSLARAMLRALGFHGAVKSPTFALLEPYNLVKFVVYHFDLYRFTTSDQWFDAGFDDILAGPGLVLIEWPEKAAGALADPDLLLRLAATGEGDERRLHARAFSDGGRRCLTRAFSGLQKPASNAPATPPPAADS